jgi:hypothetical protein
MMRAAAAILSGSVALLLLVPPASSQQAPGSTVVVPALATFTDPTDASDVVGLLQGRGETLASGPPAISGPSTSNESVALMTNLLSDGTFEVFMAEGMSGWTNRTVQQYKSKDLKAWTKNPTPALLPQPFYSASMAKDNVTGK